MTPIKPLLIAILLSSGFVLSACQEAPAETAPVLPEVTVAHPLVKPVTDWDDYIGQFEAVERVEIRPRVSGYLVGVHFEEGQLVEQGDLLFSVDPRPFEAALDAARSNIVGAQARVENARSQLARADDLVAIQAISTEEYEALQAGLRSAESELQAAKAAERVAALDVEFTRITAPVAGRVSESRLDVGNAVKADDSVLTRLVSIDPIHFSFQGSEALYLKYKRSGEREQVPVRIRLQDERDYHWQGTLDFMDNAIDAGTGTIRGRALLQNPDGFLTPGMFGQMQLRAGDEYQGLLLPDTALATRGAQRIVYVVDAQGVVAAREVELGPLQGSLRVIRTGLEADDLVVINGQQRAFPGQPVQATVAVIEDPQASTARTAGSNQGGPAPVANAAR